MKKKAIIPGTVGILVLSAIATLGSKDIESVKISFSNYQAEYDINTDIPVTVSIFPSDAAARHIEYNTDSPNITFSEDGIHTGSQEGTYSFYVNAGDIQSNTLSITVVDMETREQTKYPETEATTSKTFEEENQLQGDQSTVLADEQANQESQTDIQAGNSTYINSPNSIEEVDTEGSTEPNIPVESVPLDDTQIISDTVIAPQAETPLTDSNSDTGNGNDSNFNTYNNTEQQNTTDEYVLNTSTMKIHHPSCKSVPKIAPQNYATSNLSVNELINQGYSTCGNCFK